MMRRAITSRSRSIGEQLERLLLQVRSTGSTPRLCDVLHTTSYVRSAGEPSARSFGASAVEKVS
jgi:hypothetical protein